MTLDRRNFIKLVGGASGLALAGCATQDGRQQTAPAAPAVAKTTELMPKGGARRVVVVGGGYGGTIAAKYVRMLDPSIEVILVEKNKQFVSCPFSNFYIAGLMKDMSALTIGYDKLAANHGVKVVHAEVTQIDAAAKKVVTSAGTLSYDRCIVSPGIDFRSEEIEGYDAKAFEAFPHAYKAGPQSALLRNQLMAMKDGGTVIISMPLVPYRCPPGPYERAALAAHYFKRHKPKSKVIILDDDNTMPKQSLFLESWNKLYPGMIDWVTGNNGGKMERVDIKRRMVITTDADFPADVISFVPPQKAGAIAQKTGLTDVSGWCPVDPVTLESTRHKNIHIVGDAAFTDGVPKSAHIAGAMGRTAARAVVALLQGKTPPSPQYVNTCYTLAAPDYGFSIAGIYEPKGGVIAMVPNSVTVSPTGAPEYMRRTEAEFAYGWLRNIAAEAFL